MNLFQFTIPHDVLVLITLYYDDLPKAVGYIFVYIFSSVSGSSLLKRKDAFLAKIHVPGFSGLYFHC